MLMKAFLMNEFTVMIVYMFIAFALLANLRAFCLYCFLVGKYRSTSLQRSLIEAMDDFFG